MKRYSSSSFPSILRTHSSILEIFCSRHIKNTCVEPKQKYKYNLLTKILEIILTPGILGPPKIGGPRLKPF